IAVTFGGMKQAKAALRRCVQILVLTATCAATPALLPAQEPSAADSSALLEEVEVRAYEHHRRLRDLPAAVSAVSKASLDRFANTSLVPALNANPGVRME